MRASRNRLANVATITLAAGVNFLVNDVWTFRPVQVIARSRDPEGALAPAARSPVSASQEKSGGCRRLRVWYGLCLLLAVATYFYGLDSLHIPRNGDEYIYAHITRLTADSGHLLPLQSQLHEMRNTKPPLLFWQGIASTQWGRDLRLWSLRYPSVIYTLLTAVLVFLLGWRVSGGLETGGVACLTFLSFYSTYRYGRPFLTDAPETFWIFLPFFALLFWWPAAFESRVRVPLLLGVGLGVGFLYKSFALAVPVILALSWWYLHHRGYRMGTFLTKDAGKIAVMATVSLAVFSVWFLLDPNPIAIVREFAFGENLGKFDSGGVGYLTKLLWGGSSVWALALGYPVNAGLLAFPVVALCWVAYKQRHRLEGAEKLLWFWVVTLFLVFCIPSVRSSRYLLPAMPALAVLCALNWDRISRKAFVASLLAAWTAIATMAYLSLRLQFSLAGVRVYPVAYWLLLGITAALLLLALFVPEFTRPAVPCAALLVCLSLAAFLRPLDGPLGRYSADAQQYVRGKQVWVPCDFRAVDEGYRFLLPEADIHGYREDRSATIDGLGTRYPRFVIRLPLAVTGTSGLPLIGQRLELRSRLSSRELLDMLRGKVFDQLFVREILVEVPGARAVALPSDEGCR